MCRARCRASTWLQRGDLSRQPRRKPRPGQRQIKHEELSYVDQRLKHTRWRRKVAGSTLGFPPSHNSFAAAGQFERFHRYLPETLVCQRDRASLFHERMSLPPRAIRYRWPRHWTVFPKNDAAQDRKSTRLNSSHGYISYAVFCLKKKKN